MCRFIETICFENGEYPLLDLHQDRMNRAFLSHFPGAEPHNLTKILPQLDFESRYKVRLVYNHEQADLEFSEYSLRTIETIKMVDGHDIDYSHKYEDRSELEKLFSLKKGADEILILKDGMVTDSFYANPAFWDGKDWWVPETYLLNGVRRQHLLNTGQVKERSIGVNDVTSFEKVSLVNAMVDLGEIELNTDGIH